MEAKKYKNTCTYYHNIQITTYKSNNLILRRWSRQSYFYGYAIKTYIGPKMTNSLQFHEKTVHDYTLKYLMTSEELPNYFKFKLENKDH
jgi:hypothetical protein